MALLISRPPVALPISLLLAALPISLLPVELVTNPQRLPPLADLPVEPVTRSNLSTPNCSRRDPSRRALCAGGTRLAPTGTE